MEMEIKRFEAPTLAEALKVIKQEFGPEAIVLSTKSKRSALGLMNQKSIEVTAAIPQDYLEKKRRAELRMSDGQKRALLSEPASRVSKTYDVLSGARLQREYRKANDIVQNDIIDYSRPTRNNPNNGARSKIDPGIYHQRSASQKIGSGLGAMRDAILGQRAQQKEILTKRIQANQSQEVKAQPRPITQKRYIDIMDDDSPASDVSLRSEDVNRITPSLRPNAIDSQIQDRESPKMGLFTRALEIMIHAGLSPEMTKQVGDELKVQMIRDQIIKEDLLKMRMAKILMSRIRVARPLSERLGVPTTPHVITFVGPTGVGKTTTIAKIAAELVINQKKAVTLATTDTFKIAAVEQLEAYANILKIPLEVCPSSESIKELSMRMGAEEIILVDTPGFGPKEASKIQELAENLQDVRMETHLCFSATSRDIDLKETALRYKIFNPNYLVVTKFDESAQFGNVFNIGVKSQIPFSYFTMGQRVPEDMEVATRERLVDLLLNISGEVH